MMIKAIWKQGSIQLLEPLPPEWREGLKLTVEAVDFDDDDSTPEEIDARFDELDRVCAMSDSADEELIRRSVLEQRAESKARMRREMGLE